MTDIESPAARLRRKLDEAMAEPWDNMGELRADLALDGPGPSASGALTFHARRGDGRWVVAHAARFEALDGAQCVDDFLAETLSQLLAAHPVWLR